MVIIWVAIRCTPLLTKVMGLCRLGWANKKWGPLILPIFNSDLPDSHRREAFVQFCSLWNNHSEIWDVEESQILTFEFAALICPMNNNGIRSIFSIFHYWPVGVVVSSLASRPVGPGLIPRGGNFFTIFFSVKYYFVYKK